MPITKHIWVLDVYGRKSLVLHEDYCRRDRTQIRLVHPHTGILFADDGKTSLAGEATTLHRENIVRIIKEN